MSAPTRPAQVPPDSAAARGVTRGRLAAHRLTACGGGAHAGAQTMKKDASLGRFGLRCIGREAPTISFPSLLCALSYSP